MNTSKTNPAEGRPPSALRIPEVLPGDLLDLFRRVVGAGWAVLTEHAVAADGGWSDGPPERERGVLEVLLLAAGAALEFKSPKEIAYDEPVREGGKIPIPARKIDALVRYVQSVGAFPETATLFVFGSHERLRAERDALVLELGKRDRWLRDLMGLVQAERAFADEAVKSDLDVSIAAMVDANVARQEARQRAHGALDGAVGVETAEEAIADLRTRLERAAASPVCLTRLTRAEGQLLRRLYEDHLAEAP